MRSRALSLFKNIQGYLLFGVQELCLIIFASRLFRLHSGVMTVVYISAFVLVRLSDTCFSGRFKAILPAAAISPVAVTALFYLNRAAGWQIDDILSILAFAIVWYRGTALGNEVLNYNSASTRFKRGILFLCILAAVSVFGLKQAYHRYEMRIILLAASYLFISMVGLGYFNRAAKVKGRWYVFISFFITTAAALLYSLLEPRWLRTVLGALKVIYFKAVDYMMFFIKPLAYIVGLIVSFILGITSRLTGQENTGQMLKPTGGIMWDGQGTAIYGVFNFVKLFLIVVLIAIVSYAVYLNMSKRHSETGDDVEETRESLFTYSGAMKRAVSGLIRLGNSILHARGGFRQLTGDTPGLRIRRCYLKFLVFMRHRGLEPEKGETPYKYLSRTDMEDADAIGLTELYLLARYSNVHLSDENVRVAEKYLERIKAWG